MQGAPMSFDALGGEFAPQVNLEVMQQYIQRKVRLVGELMTVDNDVAVVKASDGSQVNIQLHSPCSFDTKYIEFTGTVANPNTIKEEEHWEFGNEFDMQSHEKMIRLANAGFRKLFMP